MKGFYFVNCMIFFTWTDRIEEFTFSLNLRGLVGINHLVIFIQPSSFLVVHEWQDQWLISCFMARFNLLFSSSGPITPHTNMGFGACPLGGSKGMGSRWTRLQQQKLTLGMWNVTSLCGKKSKLVRKEECSHLDPAGLTSMQRINIKAGLLDRG